MVRVLKMYRINIDKLLQIFKTVLMYLVDWGMELKMLKVDLREGNKKIHWNLLQSLIDSPSSV